MKGFTNPLDNVRVASPCPANWNEMYGDDRKRFCGDCKLNVYNLSDMTRQEAENLLANWEGRLCVRFYRRADGSVLTNDCPVGWRAVKQKVSRVAAAVFSLVAGLFTGVAGASLFSYSQQSLEVGAIPVSNSTRLPVMGDVDIDPVQGKVSPTEELFVVGELVDTKGEVVGLRTVVPQPVKKAPNKKSKRR